jgi:hypothetical protein
MAELRSWCFLAHNCVWEGRGELPSCSGRAVRAHLIELQTLKRELPKELVEELLWDRSVWVLACGGLGYGNAAHHGQFDQGVLRLPRVRIPKSTWRFAERYGLLWYLDRNYPV